MIKEMYFEGLNGSSKSNLIEFNPDVTIITGPNGCGKTTLLKLIWYLLSPNIERAINEINFKVAKLSTDKYCIYINKEEGVVRYSEINSDYEEIKFQRDLTEGESQPRTVPARYAPLRRRDIDRGLQEVDYRVNGFIRSLNESSLFFPTYRRIEEGGSGGDRRMFQRLAAAANDLAESIGVDNHRMIVSVSTSDIKALLNERYAATSKSALELREELLASITGRISKVMGKTREDSSAVQEAFKKILQDVEVANQKQSELFSSLDMIEKIIGDFIANKGIKINQSYSLGDINNVIDADLLSAGEKQILSFLSYNALYCSTPIIIDEPELSLHIDWQRALLPALLQQGELRENERNQFILATHSPFIYANYPDKEYVINNE